MISSPFFNLASLWRREGIEGPPGLRAPLTPIGEGTISTFQVGTWSCQSPTRWSSLLKHTVSLRGKKTAFQVKRHFFGEKNNGNIELSLTGRRRMSDFFSTVGTSSIVRSDFNLWTSHTSDPSQCINIRMKNFWIFNRWSSIWIGSLGPSEPVKRWISF